MSEIVLGQWTLCVTVPVWYLFVFPSSEPSKVYTLHIIVTHITQSTRVSYSIEISASYTLIFDMPMHSFGVIHSATDNFCWNLLTEWAKIRVCTRAPSRTVTESIVTVDGQLHVNEQSKNQQRNLLSACLGRLVKYLSNAKVVSSRFHGTLAPWVRQDTHTQTPLARRTLYALTSKMHSHIVDMMPF